MKDLEKEILVFLRLFANKYEFFPSYEIITTIYY